MKKFLVTRTRHDIGNAYLHAYTESVIKHAKDNEWKVDVAQNEENIASNIRSRLSKTGYNL